jgi:hypothetical protein
MSWLPDPCAKGGFIGQVSRRRRHRRTATSLPADRGMQPAGAISHRCRGQSSHICNVQLNRLGLSRTLKSTHFHHPGTFAELAGGARSQAWHNTLHKNCFTIRAQAHCFEPESSIEILILMEPMPRSVAPETEKLEDLAELAFPVTKEERSKASGRVKKSAAKKAVRKVDGRHEEGCTEKGGPKKDGRREEAVRKEISSNANVANGAGRRQCAQGLVRRGA